MYIQAIVRLVRSSDILKDPSVNLAGEQVGIARKPFNLTTAKRGSTVSVRKVGEKQEFH